MTKDIDTTYRGTIPGFEFPFLAKYIRMVVFYNDGTEDLCYFADQQGFIIAPDDAMKIIDNVKKYYEKYGEKYTLHNRETVSERYHSGVFHYTQHERNSKDIGGVYIIQSEGDNRAKIGYVQNVRGINTRLTTIQANSPSKLSLFRVFETRFYRELETQLHVHFSDKRIHREWFALDNADYEYIEGLNFDGSEP